MPSYNIRHMSINLNDSFEQISNEKKLNRSILLLVFVSALGGFLFGYDTGIMSGAMILIRKEFHLTIIWQELIISVTIASAWMFSLVAGPSSDYFGRKKVIIVSSVVFAIGAILMAFASNKETLMIGRIVVGIAIGFSSMCIPVYLSEMSPLKVRGRMTVINSVFITGGQFVASLVAGIFSGSLHGWRWMLGLGSVPAFIQLCAFFFAPESARWLNTKGRIIEARTVLRKFRTNSATVEAELESYSAQPASNVQESSMIALFEIPPVRRALILGCLLQLYQQISGINTVMYYSASIIAMAGVNDVQTIVWLSAVTSFFNFSFTFVGLWLVERVGRRPLTIGSIAGVTMALLSLAISFHLDYTKSPEVSNTFGVNHCSIYESCSLCTQDSDCGFCFYKNYSKIENSSCLVSNKSAYNEISTNGDCSLVSNDDSGPLFAYNWCPSSYAWLSIVGLCIYLCFFAPGLGPMPWSINSEIYPNWARAKATAIATSVNWAANLFVSLTFLSLTETITKHGTFYMYTGFAFSGLIVLSLILPETKDIPLEEVEYVFREPLFSLRRWKQSRRT